MNEFFVLTSMQNVGKLVEYKGPWHIKLSVAMDTKPEVWFEEQIVPMVVGSITPIVGTEQAMVKFVADTK